MHFFLFLVTSVHVLKVAAVCVTVCHFLLIEEKQDVHVTVAREDLLKCVRQKRLTAAPSAVTFIS